MSAIREVAANVFLLEMPLPFERLPVVNVYLVRDHEEFGMVDCGMNIEGAFEALSEYLKQLGASFRQIRQILVTHSHPDHIGLSGKVREASGGNLVLHRDEAAVLPSRYVEVDEILRQLAAYLRRHGTPEDEVQDLRDSSLAFRSFVTLHRPDVEVLDGSRLRFGDTCWDLVWTPGHTAGHVVAYDSKQKLLFSGDHLLYKISPNVSKHPQNRPDPLHDFEASLRKVAAFDVEQTLPAHGVVFGAPGPRVHELLEHHQARRDRCIDAISGASSAWDVSRTVFSRATAVFDKRMALFETLAHLEALKVEGRVVEENDGERTFWCKPHPEGASPILGADPHTVGGN